MPHVGSLNHEESVDHNGQFIGEQPFGDTIAWVHRVDGLSFGGRFLQRCTHAAQTARVRFQLFNH